MRIKRRSIGRMRIRRRTRKSTIATETSTRAGAIRATIALRREGRAVATMPTERRGHGSNDDDVVPSREPAS